MQVKIAHLSEYIDSIPLLAMWVYSEWGKFEPDTSINDMIMHLAGHIDPNHLPTSLVAVSKARTVGSVSVVDHGMDTRPDVGPWLSMLYVSPESRGQGVGGRLVRAAEDKARSLGNKIMYLYTPGDAEIYIRQGWEPLSRENYKGVEVAVLRRELVED